MLYREAGQFKSTYAAGPADLPDPAGPHRAWRCCCVVAFVVVPLVGDQYWLSAHPHPVPDPRARGARAQHPHRLRRAALARHRGVHGGRRVRGLQLRCCASRACRSCVRVRRRRRCARRRWASCSACRACASRASTSRWPRSPRSSSCCGRSTKVGWFSNYSSSGVITAQPIVILGYAFDTPADKYLLVARRSSR